jgi:outer membrane protein W
VRRRRSCGIRIVPALGPIAGALLISMSALASGPARAVAADPPPAPAATSAPAANSAPVKQEKKAKAPKAAKAKSPAHVHTPEAGAWDKGALWVTLRVGFNQASYSTAGNGSVGYGFGFTRMLGPAWALAGMAERNVLGQFGEATESEIPFTIELDRHIKMSDAFRPYFGVGGGTYYHKFTNTTADYSDVRGGGLLAVGGNLVASKHSLFGVDARMAFVSTRSDVPASNPVFGPQDKSTMRWSLKATWSVTY